MDAAIQALVTNLSNGEADLTEMQRLYDDVLMGLAEIPVLVQYTTSVAPAGGAMSLPPKGIGLLLAFFNNIQIGELSMREANWLFPNWREATGTPYNFVRESFSTQQIQLVPTPPSGNGSLLTTYSTDSLPVWLQLPVALLILGQEYMRESTHQKPEVASAAQALGNFLIALLTGQINAIGSQNPEGQ